MAHVFAITNGASTFTLTSTNAYLTNYTYGNGDGETVVDTVDILIIGATGAAMQSNVRALESLFEMARRRARTKTGARVFVTANLDTDSAAWRSEIISASVDLQPDSLAIWANKMMNARLLIERRNFWEASSETELQLSAPNQSAATGGRTIYNHWDSDTGHGYWFAIAGAQVAGNLRAPIRLQLTNSAGGARAYSQVHIANNVLNDPANFVGRLEGEAASSGGSTASDASCSGGSKRNLTVNTSTTVTWALNSTFTGDTSGARFWLLARVLGLTGTVTVRPELRVGSAVVWRAHEAMQWQITDPHLAVLGTLPIPPGGWDATWGTLTLALVFTSTVSVSLSIDYLAFLPCDGYQLITMIETNVADGSAVVVDGISNWAGVVTSGLVAPLASPRGNPLTVEPGVTQRFYVLQNLAAGNNIADTFSVRAWYRARRLSV